MDHQPPADSDVAALTDSDCLALADSDRPARSLLRHPPRSDSDSARLLRRPPAPSVPRKERERGKEEEREGRGKKRGLRLTCGAYVGTTILKLFFLCAADTWGHAFYYFPSYNCHISATATWDGDLVKQAT